MENKYVRVRQVGVYLICDTMWRCTRLQPLFMSGSVRVRIVVGNESQITPYLVQIEIVMFMSHAIYHTVIFMRANFWIRLVCAGEKRAKIDVFAAHDALSIENVTLNCCFGFRILDLDFSNCLSLHFWQL